MLLTILPLGCGGEQGASPAQMDAGAASPTDPGSGPTDCSLDAQYEFQPIEDFELGAATGWYLSDETCDDCKLLFADLCEPPSATVQASRPSSTAPCLDVLADDDDTIANDGGTDTVKNILNTLCLPYCGSSPVPDPGAPITAGACANGNQAGRLQGQPPLESPFGGPYIGDCRARAPAEIAAVTRCLTGCVDSASPRTQSPPNPPDPIPAELIPGGRCNARFAMHIVAGPFVDWGGTFGRTFGTSPKNGTGWDGISFWSRVGPGSSDVVRVNVGDEYTDSSYNQTLAQPHCNPNSGKYDSYTGCDKFGGTFTPGPDWQHFFIAFSEMRQGGWGQPQVTFDIANILSMEFAFKGPSWDLWLDDIAFYRRRKQQ